MTKKADDGESRSLLERALNVVTEVRAGEGVTALLLTLNVFLLLSAYYFIKPVREGLIVAMPGGKGPEYKSYLSGAISVSLLFAVPAYAWVASRVAKHKLVVGVTLFFASHLALFWVLSKIPAAEQNIGFVFFVWVGIFNMMIVAQFWAFANDLYTVEQGKRLFAVVGMGASIGSAVGAKATGFLLDTIKLGVYELLIVAGILLVGSAALTWLAYARESRRKRDASKEEPEKDRDGAFRMVLRHRYLILIAAFSLIFTWVNTNGEYMLSVLARDEAAEAAKAADVAPDQIGAFAKGHVTSFYASFFLWVNVLSVLIQTFLVSRIVKFGGLRVAFFILPIICLVDAAAVFILPAAFALKELVVLRPGKIAENATDYSLNNTVRNMLWLPTTREMKYKGKQAVDTFFVRMGDVASAALVYLGASVLKLPVRGFALLNGGLILVWLVLAVGIIRHNRKMTEEQGGDASDAPAKRA